MATRHKKTYYKKSYLKTEPPSQQSRARQKELRARFNEEHGVNDGYVFVGVSSTGVYCRPTCKSRPPKQQSCTYFESAAEAEKFGYRPCMHCRPEIAPAKAAITAIDDDQNLAYKMADYLREYASCGEDANHILERFGLPEAQIKRLFNKTFNVTPAMYLQTTRLLLAKLLLFDTNLPVTQVAEDAGFKSTRTLNSHFKTHYHLTPLQMRYQRVRHAPKTDTVSVRLSYRPPIQFDALLEFFKTRAIEGIELVDDTSYMRTVKIDTPTADTDQPTTYEGMIRVTNKADQCQIILEMSRTLTPITSIIIARVKRLFDLDCDPHIIASELSDLNNKIERSVVLGTRLPGCFDAFETVCRAILGQQVSVGTASTIASRIAKKYGSPIETNIDELKYAWPSPARIIEINANEEGGLEQAFGELGVVKARSASILAIAQNIENSSLDLSVYSDPQEQMDKLCEIKGIGPWTANYIAMRVLGYTDAFLEGDVGIRDAMPGTDPKERLKAAELWRPYRSYAIINLWNSLS